MENVDFYKILGVSKDATEDDIRKAYRKCAAQWHPDKFASKSDAEKKEAEAKFKQIGAAYECLKDPEKRAIYDQHGVEGLRGGMGSGGEAFTNLNEFLKRHFSGFGFGFGGDDEGFNPFGGFHFSFTDRNGHAQRQPPSNAEPEDGRTYRLKVPLSLSDAIYGTDLTFKMSVKDKCPDCYGRKCAGYEKCSACGGTGMSSQRRGMMLIQSTCEKCGGSGFAMKDPCKKCSGTGRVDAKREIKLKIPVGIANGETLRVRGQGDAGINGGVNGDVLITVAVEKSNGLFTRRGDKSPDLEVDCYIPPAMGVVGGEWFAIKPDGTEKLTIKPNTLNGTVVELKNCGIGGKGSLFAKIVYDTLDYDMLNDREKKILKDQLTLNDPHKMLRLRQQLDKVREIH